MKESILIKNIKQVNPIGELKKLLDKYPNEPYTI